MDRTQHHLQPSANWELIHDADDNHKWTWRRLRSDGSGESTSTPHPDFGAAVGDAIKHGFRPSEQHWVVKDRSQTTYYQPGDAPFSVRTDAEQEPFHRIRGSLGEKPDEAQPAS